MSTEISRRNFLKTTGGGLAATALTSSSSASEQLQSQKSPKTSNVQPSYPYGCRLIDIHAHVFANPKIRNTAKASLFLNAEQQIEIMNRLGVEKAAILPFASVEAPGERQSIGEVLSICDKFPGRFVPFCNLDPRLPKHPDKLEVGDYVFLLTQYKDLGCKGLGEFTGRLRWDDRSMLFLLEAC
ncbi:MAG: twin-arginine translocation signal domain-containing protein, partial [Planctomycetota bacterium]